MMRVLRARLIAVVLFPAVIVVGCSPGGESAQLGTSTTTAAAEGSLHSIRRTQANVEGPLTAYLADSSARDPQTYLIDVQLKYEKLRSAYAPWASAMQAAEFPAVPSDGVPSKATAVAYQQAFGRWLDGEGQLIRTMSHCIEIKSAPCASQALATSQRDQWKEQMLAAGRRFDSEARQN